MAQSVAESLNVLSPDTLNATGEETVHDESVVGTVGIGTALSTVDGFEVAEDPTLGNGLHSPLNSVANGVVSSDDPNGLLGSIPAPLAVTAEPVAAKVQTFKSVFLIRVPRPDVSDLQAEITVLETKLEEKRKESQKISAHIKEKQAARKDLIDGRRDHRERAKSLNEEVKRKYDDIRPVQDKMKGIKDASSEIIAAGRGLPFSSVADLENRIAEIDYIMKHESNSLNDEKKYIRELQQLNKSRSAVEAMEIKRGLSDPKGQAVGLQTQLKPLMAEVEALKEQRDAENKIADTIHAEIDALDAEIEDLWKKRDSLRDLQDATYAQLQKLRQKIYERELDFKQNRRDLFLARKFVDEKDVKGLETFASEQVERLLAKWKSSAFRAEYVKANEVSTLRRFHSLDTRRPGVNNTPAVSTAPAATIATTSSSAKAPVSKPAKKELPNGKKKEQPKPEAVVLSEEEAVETKAVKSKGSAVPAAPPVIAMDEFDPIEAAAGLGPTVAVEDDEVAREKKKEEARAKAKEAEERKKRQAERSQIRAAAKAAREAEEAAKKKEKERLKRERKKALAAGVSVEGEDNGVSASEDIPVAADADSGVVPGDTSASEGDRSLRSRKRGGKQAASTAGKVSIPKRQGKKGSSSALFSYIGYIAGLLGLILVAVIAIVAVYTPRQSTAGA